MITAVDTNILSDILRSSYPYYTQSLRWLRDAQARGQALICDIVYAELVYHYTYDRDALEVDLQRLNVEVSSIDTDIAYEAGLRWAQYRREGGPRNRVLPDFLIGAHAIVTADTLSREMQGFTALISLSCALLNVRYTQAGRSILAPIPARSLCPD